MKRSVPILFLLLSATPIVTAVAATADQPPAVYSALMRCRGLPAETERLACYDEAVAKLETATRNREVVLVDREHIRNTKRKLFGLPLPDLNLFGDDREGRTEQVDTLEGEVAEAHTEGDGNWVMRLKDGAVWMQTDGRPLAVAPRGGTKVVVKRAAMGSFIMRVNRQPGIRVRRAR